MKVRSDKNRGFILTSETDFEKTILDAFRGEWFTARKGVGGDMLFRITNKDAPLDAWKDSTQPTTSQLCQPDKPASID